jgi:hypothetical protein
MIKKIVFALAIVAGLWSAGCETMTRDSDQQIRKYSRISDINRRMLAEDVDTILLLDAPSSLTHWQVPKE